MVDTEHAVIYPMELEAKASEQPWPPFKLTPDPDILHRAAEDLMVDGELDVTIRRTKGARDVPILHMADLSRRKTAYESAAARKGVLQARYLGWSSGAAKTLGILGPAGERVVRESFKQAAAAGYVMVNPDADVRTLFGERVPGGPLDTAAFLTLLRDATPILVGVLCEMKNVRGRIYPQSREIYQLLFKAASLQVAHPEHRFLPLLVCRRLQHITGFMARELGFFGVDLRTQYAPDTIDAGALDEVRRELGYVDLTPSVDADAKLVRVLQRTLPRDAYQVSQRWAETAPSLIGIYDVLRQERADRKRQLDYFYDAVRDLPTWQQDWPRPRFLEEERDEEEPDEFDWLDI